MRVFIFINNLKTSTKLIEIDNKEQEHKTHKKYN